MVSALYMALQAAVAAGYLLIPVNGYLYLAVVVCVLSAAYVAFMRKYYHLHQG